MSKNIYNEFQMKELEKNPNAIDGFLEVNLL